MFSSIRASALIAALALAVQVQAIAKISRVGRYLYDDSGARFYIKGIAYQEQGEVVHSDDNPFGEPSTFIDPLALGDACERDLPFLQRLGVNALRIYSVDSSKNHDACMKLLSDNGIYTIIDLGLPLNGSIARNAPSWSTNLQNQYIRTIDAFSKYDNVLAYNVGNEVVLADSTDLAPFVKAAARDIKAYLKSKKINALIGYAAINGAAEWRGKLADYLSCDSEETAIDLYGLNDYSWCGDSSFSGSYAGTFEQFKDYNVAAYLSEYGCITGGPRQWTEVDAIYSTDMSPVWSGGIAFAYFNVSSSQGAFGLVSISADGKTVTTSDDFDKLETHLKKASGPNTPSQSSSAASTYGTCPTPDTTTFLASNTLPPTPNESACNCVEDHLSCQFSNAKGDYTTTVGALLNTGCSMLGEINLSCNDIGSDGRTGVYGRLSGCDPIIKASYVMSQYYEGNKRAANACDFAGNGTVNTAASSTDSATAVASSCVANPSATFAPSSPASTAGGNSPTGTGRPNSGNSNNNNSALSPFSNAFVGVGSMILLAVGSVLLTLA